MTTARNPKPRAIQISFKLEFTKIKVTKIVAATNFRKAVTKRTRLTLYYSKPGLFKQLIELSSFPMSVQTPSSNSSRAIIAHNAIPI